MNVQDLQLPQDAAVKATSEHVGDVSACFQGSLPFGEHRLCSWTHDAYTSGHSNHPVEWALFYCF